MTAPAFVVRIADLEEGPRDLRFPISRDWLARALEDTEAEPRAGAGNEVGELDVQVVKNGREILVRGKVAVRVTLPCARTLDPAHYDIEPDVFLLLGPKAPVSSEHDSSEGSRGARRKRSGAGEVRGGKHGHKSGGSKEPDYQSERHASHKGHRRQRAGGKGGWSVDPELSAEEAARDTYSGEQVALDDFVREFILLELPMFPVREDLRSGAFDASSPHPSGSEAAQPETSSTEMSGEGEEPGAERPLDPRLSPLAELKARLEKKE